MEKIRKIPRRNAIPILYTRGTHYDVGFDMGRTFSALIRSFLELYQPLNCTYLRLYDSEEGKEVYNETLEAVKKSFPQYVRELEGIADGAKVEFHKLFLIHMDEILPQAISEKRNKASNGCSTILVNRHDCQILGHTEDALSETLNHYYFVDAHIISDMPQGIYRVREEKFFSLCYAGCLPGYTMNYNHHGLVFSVNTIDATHLRRGKIPRTFLTRALLAAENYDQAETILRNVGVGAADGCTINMIFAKRHCEDTEFYNIEMGPALEDSIESQLDIKIICIGQFNYHANRYLRLKADECNEAMKESSEYRMNACCAYAPPKTKGEVIKMLGDTKTKPHCVFRENGDVNEFVKTICIGIFDVQHKMIALYSDNPAKNEPIAFIPMKFKDFSNGFREE